MIKVLIVNDSAVVRQVLSAILSNDPQINVIATANDPFIAKNKMSIEWPDVIVLDIEMPRMDGITFLKIIMAERPTPVVICSTLTEKGTEITLQAMAAGAVGFVTKPKIGLKDFLSCSASELIQSVKNAAQSRPKRYAVAAAIAQPFNCAPAYTETTEKIVAIGTSTGGTQALETVLTALPRVSPGVVIVQHMPEKFTALFAKRLNDICAIEVREAEQGDHVLPGSALIAPGGLHMRLTRSGAYYHVDVLNGPLVNRHKPSVDILFKSVAQVAGRNALGIIMTGMGDDGARGLRDMHDAGAYTVAQNEASCVVFGMPKEAIKLQAVDVELPVERISAEIMRFMSRY